ncbi:hypothetical protein HDU76_001953 [Blyttiomyces sp. JEL0837]|nr:hypothetical protein HDU76_001953 [Blyttiomyces sp. JEL0837]
MAVAISGAAVATGLGLYLLYRTIVPKDDVPLGNLSHVKPKKGEKTLVYPPDFFGPGNLADLPTGKTHYFLLGPEQGPKLVLIHGISSGWAAMPSFVNTLASKGFRVLAYDLYGRGYSAAPGSVYDENLYVAQLKGLLDSVGWEQSNVLGYSLGGGIAAAFAARYSNRVNHLALVAPAGLMRSLPLAGRILALPVIGKVFAHSIGRRALNATSGKNHDPRTKHLPHMKHYMDVTSLVVLRHPGFMRAYLSTIKEGPIRNLDHRYEKIEKELGDRILCLWGTKDKVVSYSKDFPLFKRLVPSAHVVECHGAGHSIIAEHEEFVVSEVVKFIKP